MYNGVSDEISSNTEDYKEGYLKGIQDAQSKKEVVKDIVLAKESQTLFQKSLLENYGSFYFNFYNRIKIENQFLFRFMFVCSYMNYDNYLSNGVRLMKEDEFKNILKLKDSEYYKTKKCFLENELISIDGKGNILINKRFCKKGEINTAKNIEVIRMFNNAIKELYDKSLPREHKKLSLLIEILPYINFRYNIICSNPDESNMELIKPIKMSELCELLGYDKTNSSKLKRMLFSLRVSGEEVIGLFEKSCGKAIFVNPRVYYKGNDEDELNLLQEMFRIII